MQITESEVPVHYILWRKALQVMMLWKNKASTLNIDQLKEELFSEDDCLKTMLMRVKKYLIDHLKEDVLPTILFVTAHSQIHLD